MPGPGYGNGGLFSEHYEKTFKNQAAIKNLFFEI